MKRYAIFMRMKKGRQDEYKKRHDEIWPEMKELLNLAGFKNYSIWNTEDMLFQYFEVGDYKKAKDILGNSDTKRRWDEFMSDIIFEEEAVELSEMFYFSAKE